MNCEDADGDDIVVDRVAKTICSESKELAPDSGQYEIRVGVESVSNDSSATILNLLSKISPKLDNTLPAKRMGNAITSTLHHPTTL